MRTKFRYSATVVTLALSVPASADIIYSNLQNTPIPFSADFSDWTGVTVVPVTGGTGAINPFFGGVGVFNNANLQPVRDGTDSLDTIVNLGVGTTISNGTLYFSSGDGGSEDHVGTTFTAGSEGYIGFKADGNYGWMRVVFTYNSSGALIKDWAYDNSGSSGSIVVGRIQESVVDSTHNLVTLSPGTGEAFTLGSTLADKGGGVTNSVTKTGAGTTTIAIANSYSGGTIVNNGKLIVNNTSGSGTGSGAVLVKNTATLGGSGTIGGNVTIENGGTYSPGNSPGLQTVSGDLTFNSGSIFEWEIDRTVTQTRGTGYDAVNVGGTLSATTGAIFRIVIGDSLFNHGFWSVQRTWSDIFSGTISSSLASIFNGGFEYYNGSTPISSPSGVQGSFSWNTNTLTWTPQSGATFVPEPTSALAGLLLAAGLLRRRR